MPSNSLVLVTGGSGFLASHCILQLLAQGYRVRTTVRNLSKADNVRAMLSHGGASKEAIDGVEFCAAELTKDDGWTEACRDCMYVLHMASPFPPSAPKHEDDLIVPAREGTLRALRAAKEAGTVGYGHHDQGDKPFTEKDWTELEKPARQVPAYQKSKTIAERAAWDWITKEGGEMELAVVNPVGIFGPIPDKNYASSIEVVARLMNGQLPGCPRLSFGIVDVRDVASLHLLAMISPKAAGQRYIAQSGDYMTIHDVAMALKTALGPRAKKVPTRMLPDFLLRILALWDGGVAMVVPELGKYKNASSEKARMELGWEPRGREEAVVETAESLGRFGLLK